MICVDGGSGLLAALPMVYDKIPVQRPPVMQSPESWETRRTLASGFGH